MLGALYGTANIIVPTSSPLLLTPVVYSSLVPTAFAVFMWNGCPLAFKLNVYVTPLTKVKVGFEPLAAPANV